MKADDKPTDKTPKPDEKVKVINHNPGNGEIGGVATPIAADLDAWIAAGWVRD